MRIAMLSPYALASVGGVQGQVIGLSRALRARGHEVTVVAPTRDGDSVPDGVGDHYVIGRPTGLRSNGSVAPVALWPTAAARAERFVRRGGFDVVHVHEPLAPMAAYGLVLTAPLPMVGTYHRAGVSRWVRPLQPLTELVGRRLQIRVAVSEAARETGRSEGGGEFEVLFNGVEMDRFESARPVRDPADRPTVLFLGRHEPRKGLPVLLDAFATLQRPAVLWVAGDGPGTEVQRRRQLASDPVQWLGLLSDERGGVPPGGGRRAVRTVAAGRVLRHGAARGHGGRLRGRGIRHRGLPHGGRRPRHAGAARRRRRPGRRPRRRPGRSQVPEASTQARKEATEYARAWSMDTLAERYLDVYERAIAAFRAMH